MVYVAIGIQHNKKNSTTKKLHAQGQKLWEHQLTENEEDNNLQKFTQSQTDWSKTQNPK